MMKLLPINQSDLRLLQEWMLVDVDPDHHDADPAIFLTGSAGTLLTFQIDDDEATPAMFVRISREGDAARIEIEFAPEAVVSRRRVAGSIATVFPKIIEFLQSQGILSIIYDSVSPSLIKFLMQYKFERVAETNDYVLQLS
jgi:hypothetical protein